MTQSKRRSLSASASRSRSFSSAAPPDATVEFGHMVDLPPPRRIVRVATRHGFDMDRARDHEKIDARLNFPAFPYNRLVSPIPCRPGSSLSMNEEPPLLRSLL